MSRIIFGDSGVRGERLSKSVTAIDSHRLIKIKAKEHLSPEFMQDFATNKDTLSKEDKLEIEDHISDCDRCRNQIISAKSILKYK